MNLTQEQLKKIIREELEALQLEMFDTSSAGSQNTWKRDDKKEKELDEEKLTSKARGALPDSDFIYPEERKYPIPDISHARNALTRVAQHGTPAEKKRVSAAVHRKYPSIDSEEG